MLTVAAVRKSRCKKGRREIPDGRGLYLIVYESGRKSWCLRFRRPGGRRGKLTLGTCDETGSELEGDPEIGAHLTLPAARKLASDIHRLRAQGKDVIAERRVNKQKLTLASEDARRVKFVSAAQDYVTQWCRDKKQSRTWWKIARTLGLEYRSGSGEPSLIKGGLAERWRDVPVSEITEVDVDAVVDEAAATAIPGRTPRRPGRSAARERDMINAISGLSKWLRKKRKLVLPIGGLDRERPNSLSISSAKCQKQTFHAQQGNRLSRAPRRPSSSF